MTSTELVQSEIRRFLSSKEPEVLCIQGQWGIGKTYVWQAMLDEAKERNAVALDRYAYVSLFGIDSLERLKLAFVENLEFIASTGASPPVSAARKGLRRVFKTAQTSAPVFAEFLPGMIREAVKAAGPLLFGTVRNQIICIDDLERKGANLAIKDVLGLVSFLKEQRKCKVVLILNDEAFDAQGREEFHYYFEKVVDAALRFAPEPEDSVRIALPGTDTASKLIGENCRTLRISNIRLIKKVERLVRNVEPLLSRYDEAVFREAAHSLTLLGWSKYQPGVAPPLDLVKDRGGSLAGLRKDDMPAAEAAWNALLDDYGFTYADEFDLALLKGIENGFFDPDAIGKHAAERDKAIKLARQNGSFEQAWQLYHDSFADDHDAVLDAIHASFKTSVQSITPLNLNATVSLFKDLGRGNQTAELIDHYMAERDEPRNFWDLDDNPFGGEVTDPDVRTAFRDRLASFRVEPNPVAILERIAVRSGWHAEDLAALAGLSVEEYYEIFKNQTGKELRRAVDGALQFDRIVDATAQMHEISARARRALERIGRESAINARRVKKYGIDVTKPAQVEARPAEPGEG